MRRYVGLSIASALVGVLLVPSCNSSSEYHDAVDYSAGPAAAPSVDAAPEAESSTPDSGGEQPWVCKATRALTVPERFTATPAGGSHFSKTCASDTAAYSAEEIYSLAITEKSGLRILATTTETAPVVRLLTECSDDNAGRLCADRWAGKSIGAALYQGFVDAGTYFLVVDQILNGAETSPFSLAVSTFPIVANTACASAQVLDDVDAGAISGDVRSGYDSTSRCIETDAGQLFYKVSVKPGTKKTCTLTPTGAWKAAIGLTAGSCGASTCADKAVSATDGAPVSLEIDNFASSGGSKDFIVAITGTDVTTAGAFSLAVKSESLASCTGTLDGTATGPTTHCCGGSIVPNNANATCGSSCSACPVPAHGSVACNGTTCVPSCQAATTNWDNCDSSWTNGCETNLATTATKCGACTAAACPSAPNGGLPACVDRKCTFTCPLPKQKCAGEAACIDTISDPKHCGGCGHACPAVPGTTTATCASSKCVYQCLPGYCPKDPNDLSKGCVSVNTSTDPNHCGQCNRVCPTVAGTDRGCSGVTCTYTCSSGYCANDPNDLSKGCKAGNTLAACAVPGLAACQQCKYWLNYNYCVANGCCQTSDGKFCGNN